jgi:serine/threonine protein kinase
MNTANQKKVMHLDLKPLNIFLSANKNNKVELKILNLGQNKNKDYDKYDRLYMSPQMFNVDPATRKTFADQRADTWSLGVILFRLMTFQLPFKDQDSICDAKILVPFDKLNGIGFSRELVDVVKMLLKKSQDGRPTFAHLMKVEQIE